MSCDAVRGEKKNVWKIRKNNCPSSSQAASFRLGEYNLLTNILMFWFTNCVNFNFLAPRKNSLHLFKVINSDHAPRSIKEIIGHKSSYYDLRVDLPQVNCDNAKANDSKRTKARDELRVRRFPPLRPLSNLKLSNLAATGANLWFKIMEVLYDTNTMELSTWLI